MRKILFYSNIITNALCTDSKQHETMQKREREREIGGGEDKAVKNINGMEQELESYEEEWEEEKENGN